MRGFRHRSPSGFAGKTPKTAEMIEHFFTELERPAKTLTAWEQKFVTSARDQFDRRGTLTDRQFEILERVYSERTA